MYKLYQIGEVIFNKSKFNKSKFKGDEIIMLFNKFFYLI